MIETIALVNYQDSAECRTDWAYSREGFLKITYQLKRGNVYGLVSDFGCGSWGLATCLGGRGNESYTGKVLLNNVEIHPKELVKHSGFITEKVIPGVNCIDNLSSAKECIQTALQISGEKFSVEEIKSIFHLSDERFERPLEYVSGEIWLISMAIQFALGKEIFCYPWLSMREIFRLKAVHELNVLDYLRNTNKIVLVPTSQKKLAKKICDHIIEFKETKIKV